MSKNNKREALLTIRIPRWVKNRIKQDAQNKGQGTTMSDITNEILKGYYD